MSLSQLQAPRASRVIIRPVLNRRDREAFVRLPWSIYRDDPQWVPPLLKERREFIGPRKHPFYLHGAARQFLAYRGGVPVGRISVSDDQRFNDYHGANLGCFGMFESIDDFAVAEQLFGAAAEWLVTRGRDAIRGPIDYSMNYSCGLLVRGFDTPPRVMMNHNPPYYAALIEQYGFRQVKDLYSWWFVESYAMRKKWQPRVDRIAARGEITVRPFDFANIETEVRNCQAIYNEAWRDNWGFVPMSEAEVRHLIQHLRSLAIPEMLLIAERHGTPVGFSMCLPDFNEAMRPLDGKLFNWGLPIGLFRFLRRLRHIRAARLLALGVAPAFRGRGVAELLILRTMQYGKDVMRYDGAEVGWTLDDNDRIIRPIEAVGGERYKTYRIYEKSLA